MSRLQKLFHSTIDHLFPPAWPDLSGFQFFTAIPGAWKRDDNRGLCAWGYASLRLPVEGKNFSEKFELFIHSMSMMDIASLHVGLASWPAPESDLQDWYGAQSASESLPLQDLMQSRKTWLKSLGLRERLGYVIARVKLKGDDASQQAQLAELQAILNHYASELGYGHRPLTRAEVVRLDADCKAQGKDGLADFELEEHNAPLAPVLMQALGWADHEGYALYHATLDIVPEAGVLRAATRVRIHNPEFGRRTLEMELHRCGITMRKIAVRRHMHFPRPREVSRWHQASNTKLLALAPCAELPVALGPRAGGTPLRSMTGELRVFSPFEASMGANTLLLGEPSKTHVVACEVLTTSLAGGAAACVIDDTGSFNHLADAFNGEVQRVTTEGPHGLDPLRLVDEPHDISTYALVEWLSGLAGEPAPSENARFLLSEALRTLWQQHPRAQFTLTNLHGILLGMGDPRARDLADAIAPCVGDGQYAHLFEGPSREVPENLFTVFDLSAWKGHAMLPHIAQAVLCHQARRQARKFDEPDQWRIPKKLFVHSLSKSYGEQLQSLTRSVRLAKKYAMGVTAVARPADVEPGGVYHEFAWNFPNLIALSLTEKAVEAMDLDRHIWNASIWRLSTTHLYESRASKRAHMQLLLATPEGAGFFELRLDPASQDLFALRQAKTVPAREDAMT